MKTIIQLKYLFFAVIIVFGFYDNNDILFIPCFFSCFLFILHITCIHKH